MIAQLCFLLFVSTFARLPKIHHHEHVNPNAEFATSAILEGEDAKLIDPLNATVASGWTLFKQCDSRWGANRLGTCSLTVCQAGCAMSSVAMLLATKGAAVDPGSFNKWLTSNAGYAGGCNIYWAKADSFGKTHFQSIQKASEAAICSGISAGHGIIANVNAGAHWVLLTGCKGGGVFTVNDPGFNKATYTYGEIVQEAVYH